MNFTTLTIKYYFVKTAHTVFTFRFCLFFVHNGYNVKYNHKTPRLTVKLVTSAGLQTCNSLTEGSRAIHHTNRNLCFAFLSATHNFIILKILKFFNVTERIQKEVAIKLPIPMQFTKRRQQRLYPPHYSFKIIPRPALQVAIAITCQISSHLLNLQRTIIRNANIHIANAS